MRSSTAIILATSAVWLTEAVAQRSPEETPDELLCEQCPFDAPVRAPYYDFDPRANSPEMRSLGVISVRDMIDQLPNDIAGVSTEAVTDGPFDLGASIANMRGLRVLNGGRMTETASGESESAADDEVRQDRSDSSDEESDTRANDGEPE